MRRTFAGGGLILQDQGLGLLEILLGGGKILLQFGRTLLQIFTVPLVTKPAYLSGSVANDGMSKNVRHRYLIHFRNDQQPSEQLRAIFGHRE